MALTAKAVKGNVAAADKLLSLTIQALGFEEDRPEHKALSDTKQLTCRGSIRTTSIAVAASDR